MSNVYYSPEKFGLRPVKDHDTAGSYEFNMIVVWHDERTGKYLIGHDSGCSCPMPFEDTNVTDLIEVKTLADVAAFARGIDYGWDESDVVALLEGLRLDGLPTVVDGSVADEAAITSGLRAIEQ